MQIKQLLNKYRKTLTPSEQTEIRVYMKVFGELPNSQINTFNMLHKPLFKYLSVLVVVLAVVAVPLSYSALNRPGVQPVSLANEQAADVYVKPRAYNELSAGESKVLIEPYRPTEDTSTPQGQRAMQQAGEFTLECVDVRAVFNQIKELVAANGGYIQDSRFGANTNGSEASLQARIPVAKFNEVVQQLARMNVTVTAEKVTSIDRQNVLTELQVLQADLQKKITDLEAKIAAEKNPGTKVQLESQLVGLQNQKKANTEDIQEITQETSFSTLEVKLTTGNMFSLGGSWGNILKTAQFVVIFWAQVALYAIVPLSLITLVVLIWKRRKSSK